jgi:hypothetical protein
MNAISPTRDFLVPAAHPTGVAATADCLTILQSAGPLLTKVFDGGEVHAYDLAKHFSVESRPVTNLRALSALLVRLAGQPRRCVIRGRWIGEDAARAVVPPDAAGRYPRLRELYAETPHHWVMIDVDRYEPLIADPLTDPVAAIEEFIRSELPAPFHDASYHWQLSASAGRQAGVLKCHLWFWLATAYTGPQLKAWVRAEKIAIDVSPLRRVQVHYTAAPQFINGARDPVAVRHGFHPGAHDEVPLVIAAEVLEHADRRGQTPGADDDPELPDPTKKPGPIGAFCRAYPISRAIAELLPEAFAFADGSERRVTWLQSESGAAEGCFVTGDDHYLGNTHNSDPFDGRLANAWDLVRVFRFGDQDRTLTEDERALCEVQELPSHQAMLQWVASLAGGREGEAENRVEVRDALLAQIREVATEAKLRDTVLPAIAAEPGLTRTDLDVLALALQVRMTAFTGVRVTLPMARAMLRAAGRPEASRRDLPAWLGPYVYVSNGDYFFDLDTRERMTRQGFDINYNRFMRPYMDEDGAIPAASRYAADVWQIECVANVAYNPTLPRTFVMGTMSFANTYSEANFPRVPPVLTDAEAQAVALFEAHSALLLPDERERQLFLDWLAHNVQFPGRKIRWSPYLYGLPGAGKTLYKELMSAVMGPDNVRPLNADTILNSAFNEWANGAALAVIEEIRAPDHSAREAENKLKAPVSNTDIEIHPKGAKSYTVINVTNYLILSNFGDGLPLDENDRRYMVLKAALGKDAIRQMTEDGHYKRLFAALEQHAGALRGWLTGRKLSEEFCPDGHAPWTKEKSHVVELCRSDLHNALTDLLTDGGRGITREVISVPHLAQKLAERTGEKVFTRTLNKLLGDAGYTEGRRVFWDKAQHRVRVHELFVYKLPEDDKDANKALAKLLEATGGESFLD